MKNARMIIPHFCFVFFNLKTFGEIVTGYMLMFFFGFTEKIPPTKK